MYAEDTIAAIATPPGAGAVGVIRASGPAAESIADRVFLRHPRGAWQTHRLYRGRIIGCDGARLDDGLGVLMRRPRSYTGEDVLELHCHGNPLVLQLALESVLRHGARPARAGEFTKRAFLNGKIDLTQAEAVVNLVRARTSAGVSHAADQLFGHLSRHLGALRERLVRIKGHLEVLIDFAEEETDVRAPEVGASIAELLGDVERLVQTYERGRMMQQGLRAAITGRPNVGKSSLMNALLRADRAIVTPIPGTTRDVIEDDADFFGVPVTLSDTAGLHEAPGEVERIGVARAQSAADRSDVVLVVLDTARPFEPPLAWPTERGRTIAVLNKIDLPCAWQRTEIRALEERYRTVHVSAKEHLGLDDLRRRVVERVGTLYGDSLPTLTSARQRASLWKVRESLQHALAAVRANTPPDLVAVDVQLALDHIGAVTGLVTSEDVLDAVFNEFCIGK